MINVLMCVHQAGDVISLALEQLISIPEITRILVADGPTGYPAKCGQLVEKPTVKEVVAGLKCDKIFYQYSEGVRNRAVKCNYILKNTTKDCKWMLVVDADEVYHEDDLSRMVEYLKSTQWEIFKLYLVNLYGDFHHEIKIDQWTFRIYRYRPGYGCPDDDEAHQFVVGPNQKRKPGSERGEHLLDPSICKFFHLNGVRKGQKQGRTRRNGDGTVTWSGGGHTITSAIHDVDPKTLPRSIRAYIEKTGTIML